MASDRLTQLQDYINMFADQICNAIGCIQQANVNLHINDNSNDTEKNNQSKDQSAEELAALFGKLIAQSMQDIETLINNLPIHCSHADQDETNCLHFINMLDEQNSKAVEDLTIIVEKGEVELQRLRNILHEISIVQLHNSSTELTD